MTGLVVDSLDVRAGEVTILHGVGLNAPRGGVTGLVGPNGSGKSTLIGALAGLRPIHAGTIRFYGGDLRRLPPADRARVLAHVEQSATTIERLTVRDVVALGRIPFQSTWQAMPSARDEQEIDDAIAALDLGPLAGRLYLSLSGGEQQRVQLARALAQQPNLLLLDEPTSHLDIRAQLLVLALLRRQAAAGRTVLLALHDLNLAIRSCDHLVVMHRGTIAAEGPPVEVLTPKLLREVYQVEASIVRPTGVTHPVVVYDAPSEVETPDSG